MTPKRGLNEKLLQFRGKFFWYPYTTWIFLEASVTLRNIQDLGKHVLLHNQLCYRVPLLVSLYQLPFERNSIGIPTAADNC